MGLDDPVSKYLPYFQLQDELFIKNPITIKQLLSHTAGFPEYIPIASLKDKNLLQMYRGIPQYKEIMSQFSDEVLDKIKSREDVTRYFTNVKLQYKPGEGWQYCTDAYVIAGDLLEKVTGITWEEYLHNNIFSRLQLHRTFTDPVQLRQETDQTHYYTFDGSRIREVPTPMNPICAPAGFIYSTVNDITKYLLSHMDFVKSPLLNEKSLITMQDMIAKRSVNLGYGLGWKIRSYLDIKIVEHGGGYPGVAAYVAMIPSVGFGVVLFSNCDQVPVKEICEKVTNEFIEESLF